MPYIFDYVKLGSRELGSVLDPRLIVPLAQVYNSYHELLVLYVNILYAVSAN